MTIAIEMERRYGVRYEPGRDGSGLAAFPVTHRIDDVPTPGRHGVAAWACITIGNRFVCNYTVYDAAGRVLSHGAEHNYNETREGVRPMVRRALGRIRAYGHAQRVWTREFSDRRRARGWTR